MAQEQVLLDTISQDLFICGKCKTIYYSLQSFLDHKHTCVEKVITVTELEASNIILDHNSCSTTYLGTDGSISAEMPMIIGNNHAADVKDLTCSKCKKTFKKFKYLQAHMKLHEKPYQCLICGRCFDNSSHLKRHITSHKVWPDSLNATTAKSVDVELLSYSCSYCDSVLSNYTQFRTHLNIHSSIKKYKCIQGNCNCLFNTTNALLKHVSLEHNILSYLCHSCGKSFQSLEDISYHYRNHDQVQDVKLKAPDFKCSQCDASFKRPEKLSLHLMTENHNKPCIHCDKIFVSSKRLRMHLQIHKKSKPYQCSLCNSSFHMKKYLNSHMLKHGDGQFVCTVCEKKFRRKDVLQRHQKIHLLKKTLACPFKENIGCKKEFSRKDKLDEHVKSHKRRFEHSRKEKFHKDVAAGGIRE